MISLLLKNGAKPTITDSHGRTGNACQAVLLLLSVQCILLLWLCSTALDIARKAREGAAAVVALTSYSN